MSSKQASLGGFFAGSLERSLRGSFGGRLQRVFALVCGVALALALFAVLANPARAETFTVTKTADTSDGTCDADCSLREAIRAANTNDRADTITFASGVSGKITLRDENGQLRVRSAGGPLSIEGPGADQLSVSSDGSSRVFVVNAGAEAEIAGLTVTGGNASFGDGGGIYNDGTLTVTDSTISDNTASSRGGGLHSSGGATLKITDSTISGNNATYGGGLHNFGTLMVTDSTISGNNANAGSSDGGGIYNDGTLTVTDSTVSGNSAADVGGGIYSITDAVGGPTPNPSERTTIRNSTISGNSASSRGGGVRNYAGLTVIESSTITKNSAPENNGAGVSSYGDSRTRTDVRASIISNNTETDVDFIFGSTDTFNSLGSNIVGDGNATDAFDQPGDRTGVENPGLEALQDSGGPTKTHSLLAESPAIDGVVKGCPPPATDQRGVIRPQGTACDVGSFELDEPYVGIIPASKDYGEQQEGIQSAPQSFTVENTGDADLEIATVSIAGTDSAAFTKQNDQCESQTLAPGEACAVEVMFASGSPGTKTALLRIESDAASSPDEAQLSGTGAAVPPAPELTAPQPQFQNLQ